MGAGCVVQSTVEPPERDTGCRYCRMTALPSTPVPAAPSSAAPWLAAALPGAVLAVFLLAVAGVLAATLEPAQRTTLMAWLEDRLALVALLWLVSAVVLGTAARRLWQQVRVAPLQLAEQLRIRQLGDKPAAGRLSETLPAGAGADGLRPLAEAAEALLAQRDALRADIDSRVREASRAVELERNRLAALMAELNQSVVVCNLDGRVLLFNARARLQFRALAEGPSVGGAEPLALGRSIHAVFDRHLVAHALESVQARLLRGAAHPTAQFVTGTRSGQLLRVQLAPVQAVGEAAGDAGSPAGPPAGQVVGAPVLSGYVLMLDNITREFAQESDRDQRLHGFTEASRASLGNLVAAVELLEDPALDGAARERFQAVVRDEAAAMSRRIQELARAVAQNQTTRWPMEDMLGADLVAAAVRRIGAQAGCRADAAEVDPALWLKVDSFSVVLALTSLAQRLAEEYGIRLVQLRLQRQGARVQLDLVWFGQAMSTETVIGWETDPLRVGEESRSLTVRDVVHRHGGAFWFERERVRQAALFRFLLPLADAAAEPLDGAVARHADSRPEFYDFDLFRHEAGSASGLADRALADLSFTVFDTETTGLNPSEGDQIIQIGALRIVAGKLRRQDCFEQLVDPQRSVPAAGVAIHGIQPEMVQGQPTLDVVLPAFHAFAADTVLVAHNAAFDLRFLQLAESRTGVVFDQPVLDTLLLSAVIHPQQESHRLEAIAERLGVPVLGRHTALGDALVTAEVFLKMLPLLRERGITTLGQALDAARQTRFAQVRY
jgi:DNA polymerase-3 subunit epsilon